MASLRSSQIIMARSPEQLASDDDIGPPPVSDEDNEALVLSPLQIPSMTNASDGVPMSPTVYSPPSFSTPMLRPVARPGTLRNAYMSNERAGVARQQHNPSLSLVRASASGGGVAAVAVSKTSHVRSPRYASDEESSWASASISRDMRRQQMSTGGGVPLSVPVITATATTGGVRDAPPAVVTVLDMEQAIQRRMQQYHQATALLSRISVTRDTDQESAKSDDYSMGGITQPKKISGELDTGRDVHSFVASYLSANGYKEALRLFKKRLPLAEQRLDSCLQRRHQSHSLAATSVTREERRDVEAVPSPTYSLNRDDLLLLALERVRQEQLLNDSLPWRDINCRRKDYRLEPLQHHQYYFDQNEARRDNGGGDSSPTCKVAFGGSLDLLIEVLILVETDTPFATGMPIFNYTNTFILLSSSFVMPEVLIVRLIRLFRFVQQQFLKEDSRSVFLQRRIVQFIMAYCKYHEADITHSLLERLQRFVRSLNAQRLEGHHLLDSMQTGSNTLLQNPIPPSQRPGIFPTVAAEVALRLNELSAFIEESLQKAYYVPREVAHSFGWKRRVAVPVKPLGTIVAGWGNYTDTETARNTPSPCFPHTLGRAALVEVVFTGVDAKELADQMCILSFRLFANIHVRELLDNAWCEEMMRISVPFHLTRFIDFSSNVQRWMAAVIVCPKRWSECLASMQHGVQLCRLLYDKQNYEVAAAVLEGLQHPAVMALESLYQKQFQQHMLSSGMHGELAALQQLMDPFASQDSPSSLHSIRSRVAGDMEAPMIPLLAPVLGVLFRTEESKGKTVMVRNTDGVPVVNWSKIVALGKTIFMWIRCQSTPYGGPLDARLQQYLWQLPGHQYTDSTLMDFAKQEKLN
ncbi:hypothetical protein DQ04_02181050 [Trypanosoma grayi]|uniref:hypothetical protein n=1 Tax=Trypanosoma grayi TaxID=71804 RepID=UPI0004F443A7|nr:hypothetical protein DQ04_02181050 [Trypanosoma grayi]KEG11889.1 hypothetical protein DQ04_02181050 [Trypanosoma grayi]